jgi:thymidylate kinase
MATGTLVTVSGVDGSGKSTLVAALAARARETGPWPHALVVAPLKGDADLLRRFTALPAPAAGRQLREQWLAGYFSLLLTECGTTTVAAALREGALVIADRWVADHLVNQSYFGADAAAWQPMFDQLPTPDLAVWVDVPVPVAARRVAARAKPGVGSGEDFLRFAAVRFADLAGPTHERVDGTAPTDAAAASLLAKLTADTGGRA